MAEIGKWVMAALGIGALMVGLAGCEDKQVGPAERAGKEIDKAVEKAGQHMEKAGKEIDKAVEKAGQQIEKAGKKMQDAAADANKK